MIRNRCILAIVLLFAACPLFSQTPTPAPDPGLDTKDSQRFLDLFLPFRTENACLSPDGKHVAYSVREDDTLSVIVIALDDPGVAKARVIVGTDESSTAFLELSAKEKTPAEIRWMGFVTDDRIVVETNRNYASYDGTDWTNASGAIMAFDLDGEHARTLVTPKDVGRDTLNAPTTSGTAAAAFPTPDQAPTDPLSEGEDADEEEDPNVPSFTRTDFSPRIFDYAPDQPETLIVRADAYPRYELFKLNVRTGKLKYFAEKIGEEGMQALLDRQGNPRAAVPGTMRHRFPHRWGVATSGFGRRWKDLDSIATFGNESFRISPENFFGERAVPLGFDEDPNILYFASNFGRDSYGIYSLNLTTGERTGLSLENPYIDLLEVSTSGLAPARMLVFDRFTRKLAGVRYRTTMRTATWLRPDLQGLQTALEKRFDGRNIEILEWDRTGDRFLVRMAGTADPGAFFVFDRANGSFSQFASVAPWLNEKRAHQTAAFTFNNPAGGKISGMVTVPRAVRVKPIPMVVLLADEPWEPARLQFKRENQALADMGFVVLQLNPRGAWGWGTAHRQAAASGFDEAQTEDIAFVVARLGTMMPVDLTRVALLGSKRGGYLAVRALQLHPEVFRCAVALESTPDIGAWIDEERWEDNVSAQLVRGFFGDRERLKNISLLREPERITKPVFLLNYRGPAGELSSHAYTSARRLAGMLEKQGTIVQFHDLDDDYARRLPRSRAAVFRKIEEFLNLHIYDYDVEVGDLELLVE